MQSTISIKVDKGWRSDVWYTIIMLFIQDGNPTGTPSILMSSLRISVPHLPLCSFIEDISLPLENLSPSVGGSSTPSQRDVISTSRSNPCDGLGKSEARSSTMGAWEHLRCLGILVYLLISHVWWRFFHNLIHLRPRCCYFQSRRYHYTTKNLRHLCTSIPHSPRRHLQRPTPLRIVNGRTRTGF
jgi:hypothetical protein